MHLTSHKIFHYP